MNVRALPIIGKTPPLLLLIALTVAVRVIVLLLFPSVFAWDQTGSVHGSDLYDKLAQNLLQTGVYGQVAGVPDALVPPLYGYFVAAIYAVFGRGYLPIAGAHILLDVFCVVCLYHIARRIFPARRWVAILSCLFYALYPYLVFQNLTLIDTPLFMALLYGFLLAVILLREQWSWRVIIFGGVMLGLGLLSRPIIAPLGLFAALWYLFRLNIVQTVKRLAPVAIIGAVIVLPWLVRNYGVYQAIIPMGNNGGMNFWFGNSRYTIPFLWAGYHPQWATPDAAISPNDKIANGQYTDEAMAFLRANPGKIPELLWVKFLAHWSIDVYPSQNPGAGTKLVLDADGRLSAQVSGLNANDPVVAYSAPLFDRIGRPIHILYFGGLLLLALIGVALTVRNWREVSILWFVQVSMTVVYVLIIPATRYRVPSDPLLFVFSAVALVLMWEKILRTRSMASAVGKSEIAESSQGATGR
jgi:4-amino-4-deoxy-L-arabinose transferase-like glycosyltransferase